VCVTSVPRPTLTLPFLPDGWHCKEKVEDKQLGKKTIPTIRRYYWNATLRISIRHHPASWDGKDEIKAELAKKK
jgi:hypothetical protein